MSETTTYTVKGMTCAHCVRSVSSEVKKIDGVIGVEVELDGGHVKVTSDGKASDEDMRAAVEEAGYEVAP